MLGCGRTGLQWKLRQISGIQFCGARPEEQGGSATHVLVKCFAKPAQPPAWDDLLLIRDAELRPCWKNAQQIIPESQVLPDLAQRELALNLGKRKRDSLQRLGLPRPSG